MGIANGRGQDEQEGEQHLKTGSYLEKGRVEVDVVSVGVEMRRDIEQDAFCVEFGMCPQFSRRAAAAVLLAAMSSLFFLAFLFPLLWTTCSKKEKRKPEKKKHKPEKGGEDPIIVC